MRFRIENLLGIVAADIEANAGEVVEVVGPNAAGKTSIAVCLQALLARETNPLHLPVAHLREYAHDGAPDGFAALYEGEEGDDRPGVEWRPTKSDEAIVQWAGVEESHPFAVGLVDFTARMTGKARAALLQPILLPPAKAVIEKVREELRPYLPEADIAGCVEEIGKRGFEAAEKVFTGRMQEAKREWCAATGRRQYGSKIAADWRPEGWTADHDRMTVLDAEKALHEARADRDELLRENAVSEAVLLEAERARTEIPGLEAELEKATRVAEGLRDAYHTARSAHQAAGDVARKAAGQVRDVAQRLRKKREEVSGAEPDHACPHCGEGLEIRADIGGYVVSKHVAKDTVALEAEARDLDAERERHAEARAEADTGVEAAVQAVAHAEAEYGKAREAQVEVQRALRAARDTAAVSGVKDDESRRMARARADERVEACQQAKNMIEGERKATAQAETVEHYQAIVRALGPSGVRAGMLAKNLGRLNKGCATLCEAAGWPVVDVTAGGAITVGGRSAALCSESERWRAQAVLQLTIAALTGSAGVVLDRADLLDRDGRDGLEKAVVLVVSKQPMAIVLCATGEPDPGRLFRQVVLAGGRTVDPETGEVAA